MTVVCMERERNSRSLLNFNSFFFLPPSLLLSLWGREERHNTKINLNSNQYPKIHL